MMGRLLSIIIGLLASLVVSIAASPGASWAQEDRRVLTLSEAQELVTTRNLGLEAARARLQAVSTLARSTWVRRFP